MRKMRIDAQCSSVRYARREGGRERRGGAGREGRKERGREGGEGEGGAGREGKGREGEGRRGSGVGGLVETQNSNSTTRASLYLCVFFPPLFPSLSPSQVTQFGVAAPTEFFECASNYTNCSMNFDPFQQRISQCCRLCRG